jgi:hypothetical protein
MENQTSSKSIILNYGLYYGLLVIVANLIVYAMGMTFSTTGGIISILAIAIAIIGFPIMGISKFKKSTGGYLTWGQGLKVGVGIVTIGALISIIYSHIFTGFIEPEFYTQLEEFTRGQLMDAGLTSEQIEKQLETQSKFQGTITGDAIGLLFYIFIGFVVSAIVSAISKHSKEDDNKF